MEEMYYILWEFIYEDKEINFQRIIDSSSSERYQIKALIKGKGLIAKSISGFGQIRMPEFAEVSHLFLVREDILNINELSSIKGISLKGFQYMEISHLIIWQLFLMK